MAELDLLRALPNCKRNIAGTRTFWSHRQQVCKFIQAAILDSSRLIFTAIPSLNRCPS
jgi:hypothetical protein